MQSYPNFAEAYTQFMTEYAELGHMNEVITENDVQQINYLPHHAVFKDESTTSKIRVVFDASAKTTTNISLNDLLMVGPKIQEDSWDISLRFRQHKYVVSADIAKMYRQILVHESDRQLQRILWQQHPSETIKIYQLNTVTYGMACSPFLAVRCLQQLAHENLARFPQACNTILKDFYVDDVLTGSDTIEETTQLKNELKNILQSGGFELRKWKTNNPTILTTEDHTELQEIQHKDLTLFHPDPFIPKTLGLRWNPQADTIIYHGNQNTRQATTKRQILSNIARLYDPLGLVSRLIVKAKMIMQRLWQTHTGWDDDIPDDILYDWRKFEKDLNSLKNLVIPRWTGLSNPIRTEIHTFADASIHAYGTAVFVRTIDNLGNYKGRLICSKSRVAPLKTISIPRLELCAAVLAAQLTQKVREALNLSPDVCTYWTDSIVVLHWLQADPHRFQTFVANRISEIQRLTDARQWKHVAGKDNPADLVSRGLSADELIESSVWWNGPSFLEQSDTTWPQQPAHIQSEENLPESKKPSPTTAHATLSKPGRIDIASRFSSWMHLIRTLTYVLRFYNRLNEKPVETGPLTTEEMKQTTMQIIRKVQREAFKSEIHALQKGKRLHKHSKLLPLHPFIKDGIIRVGGRLRNASVDEDHKHPILLPADHIITNLMFRYLHRKHLHCGPEQLLSIMRLKYWVINGRRIAKLTVSKCTDCFMYSPSKSTYLMGNLPEDRVQISLRPFTTVGIDYAGPITLKESRRRGRVATNKGYIAVFVCSNTKAIHLELVSSLSTEAFMSALRRFIARRGIPTRIRSDNGTNFIGANRELKEIYDFMTKNRTSIAEECSSLNIQWQFNPPRAPNFGGLWEAAVKSLKRHLYKVTHGHQMVFEECYTLLSQIESILNSRPLFPMSSDPNDYHILTPAHFLIGDTLLEPPEYDYSDVQKTNKLTRYQLLQRMRQQLWKRWQRDYLHTLQTRSKWQHDAPTPVKVNDLVLLVDDNAPPLHWHRGRIIQTHPGSDGIIRVVSVKTDKGIYKRAVTKICVFPNQY